MKDTTRKLTESAVMVALSTVLSLFRLAQLPFGGEVTLAAMLPIVLISYRNGVGYGVMTGIVTGLIQQLIGLNNLTYFTTPLSVVAVIFLDYIAAFGVVGLGGIFRRTGLGQSVSVAAGAALATLLRYICHVISGATVWAGLSIPTEAALVYSLLYNATYMIPEAIVTILAGWYISTLADFRKITPSRRKRAPGAPRGAAVAGIAAMTVLFGGAVFSVVAVFTALQSESGTFDIRALLTSGVLLPVGIVLASCLVLSTVLFLLRHRMMRRGLDKSETGEYNLS